MNEKPTQDILSKLQAITADIGSIAKTNRNEFQKYNFRSISQAMGALQPLLVKHGVTLQPSFDRWQVLEQEKGAGVLVSLALTFWASSDGSCLTVHSVGQGSDASDKAAYKAMAGAMKYAIFNTFCIPEDGADAEYASPDVTVKLPTAKSSKMRDILG